MDAELFTHYENFDSFNLENANSPYKNKVRFLFQERFLSSLPDLSYAGICVNCEQIQNLELINTSGREPNYREKLVCNKCWLNNRQRAVLHYFKKFLFNDSTSADVIYLTEQRTHFYRAIQSITTNVVGSEYLDKECQFGTRNQEGIRNEDLTKLTLGNESFKTVICLEVLEHIPNYKQALSELHRTLEQNGTLIITVPFLWDSYETLIRATINKNGSIMHHLEPEFHGDPNSNNPCLCFYHFGWALLDELRNIGFQNVNAIQYWSPEFGYLGNFQFLITANKQ